MKTVALLLLFAFLASAQQTAPAAQRCPAPPQYPHTNLLKSFASQQSFDSGAKVYYSCAEDFTPSSGSRSVECRDGIWSKLTLNCAKVSCGFAGDIPNGKFLYTHETYIGEKLYAACNEGYTLKGLNYIVCKKAGWSGEFPSCEKKQHIYV